MKKFLTIALFAASLATSAQAVIVGFEAGYLTDNKDAYWSARVGHGFKADSLLSHQVELELGYTEHSETDSLLGNPVTAKTKIMPFTLNYRAESVITNKLGYYFGVGIGMARSSFSMPGSGVQTIKDHDTSLALQGFAGINYQASAATTLHLGLKYLWIGDADLFGTTAKVGDDLGLMAGISVKF